MLKKMLKFSWPVIIISVLISAFFAFQLRKAVIENTSRTYMPKDGESFITLINTEDTFGSMLSLGVALETPDKTILTPEYISIIQRITDAIQTPENDDDPLQFVESVDSLTSVDFVYGQSGSMTAEPLLGDDYTGTEEDVENIRAKIYDWQDMYNHVIITDDEKATQIMISIVPKDADGRETSSDKQTQVLRRIEQIVNRAIEGSNLLARFFGDPVLSDDAGKFMMSDLLVLIPFVALIVLLSLYLSFHTWAGTFFPLITVLMSTIWSVGIMAMLGFTFTLIASVIPVCLIACGSAYGIHVLTHYYIALGKIEGTITKDKHDDAIVAGLKDVWVAVILAAVTTVAGFISNITSPLVPLRSFSIFSAAGVAFSLILSATLIPALLHVTPVSRVTKHAAKKDHLTTKIKIRLERSLQRRMGKTEAEAQGNTMYNLYHFFAGSQPRLIVFVAVLVVLSITGIKHLVVDTALVNYFPKETDFRKDLAFVDSTLAGSNSLYFVTEGTSPLKTALDKMESDVMKGRFSAVKKALLALPSQENQPASQTSEEAPSSAEDLGFDFTEESSIDTSADSSAEEMGFDFGEAEDSANDAASDMGFDFSEGSDESSQSEKSEFDTSTVEGAKAAMLAVIENKGSKEDLKAAFIKLKVAVNEPFKGCMTNPEILNASDGLNDYLLEEFPDVVGKVVSFTTFIKRMNQVMHVPVTDGDKIVDASTESWVDPNIEYAKILSQPATVKDILEMIHTSYVAAGGENASIVEVVEEVEKRLNFNGLSYYEIPYDTKKYPVASREELADLVTQYLYLLSSKNMEHFTDNMTMPSAIRTQVELRDHSTVTTGKIIKAANEYAAKHFPEGYVLKATGSAEMEHTMTAMVINSQLTSIAISLIMVFIIISLSFKSAWAGIIGAIPLALTIALNFMVMGFAGINLDLYTSIIASVAIGVGIDYTIHFMETYQQERALSSNLEEVTQNTFKKSGKGIVTNAVAVGLGFLVLLFSKFIILRYIGMLVAVVMFTSSTLAMTTIPGILNAFDPKFMWTKEQKEEYKQKIKN